MTISGDCWVGQAVSEWPPSSLLPPPYTVHHLVSSAWSHLPVCLIRLAARQQTAGSHRDHQLTKSHTWTAAIFPPWKVFPCYVKLEMTHRNNGASH